ncbi:hypothetical protein JCM10207_009111 [Rhodosporidiobolus poonsookiae]
MLPSYPYTADQFNYFPSPRPFKNPYYTRGASTLGSKRNKQLKQILTLERERVDRVLERRKDEALRGVESELGPEEMEMEMDGEEEAKEGETDEQRKQREERKERREQRRKRREEVTQGVLREVVSYASVEAPPSLLPPKRYCDVTGLEAKYLDPKSTLRYHNPEVYDVVRGFQPAVIQGYLAVRGMGVVLR